MAISKETVHFVGGRGDFGGASAVNGGGCTKERWEESGDLSHWMGPNGGPICDSSAYTGGNTSCAVQNNGSGKVRIVKSGAFTDCAGSIAHILFADSYSDGWYEVTDCSSDWIDIDLAYTTDTTCGVRVGGAFDTLQSALDSESTDATGYGRTIYTNRNEMLGGTLNVGTGGSATLNSWKRIIGFNTVPGDMEPGGDYYQSPGECAAGGIDTDRCITLDAQGDAFAVVTLKTGNIELRNLHFWNAQKSSVGWGINDFDVGTTLENIILNNCRCSETFGAMEFVYSTGVSVIDFYCKPNGSAGNVCKLDAGRFSFVDSIVDASGHARGFVTLANGPGVYCSGCIVLNSTEAAILVTAGFVVVEQCSFYNSVDGISITGGGLIEFNNVFMLSASTGRAVCVDGGSVLYSDYSCAWSQAGELNEAWYGLDSGTHAVEADPEFVNPGQGDFRVRNAVVLRGGRGGIGVAGGQMGAVLQEYKFARRARVVNRNRLAVIQ